MMYGNATFPGDPELVRKVATAATTLHKRLAGLDVDRLDISDYNRSYLKRYQRKLGTHMQKFAYILAWGLAHSDKPIGRTVLLEYGGGCGILSLLARECHVGTVIYNDIYDVSCIDAETIAQTIGNTADNYVCGTIDDVADFLDPNRISCDVMVTSDVIEHVYDIRDFFSRLAGLSTGRLSIAMSSHANPRNPYVKRLLTKKQLSAEHKDRAFTTGHKKRDSLQSYLNLRRGIIRESGNGVLSNEEIETLAALTRGMIDADIRSAVFTYTETKNLPAGNGHPTNTCDPLTGNWADRLLDPDELASELAISGFDVDVLAGHYGKPSGWVKQMIAGILDFAIGRFGKNLTLSPYFLLCGWGDMAVRRTVPAQEIAQPERTRV